MGTAIIVAVIIVICVFAVRSYIKKLSHGCCGVGGDDEKNFRPMLLICRITITGILFQFRV